MGLYLAVFDDGKELDGVEVGSYADFNNFRDQIVARLERGEAGSRFPVLILHSDSDGQWTPEECALLEKELETIQNEMRKIPPIEMADGWRVEVARSLGLTAQNLDECFFDVDGEMLTVRLIELAQLAWLRNKAILFQ